MEMDSIMKYIWDINGRMGYLNYSNKLDNLIVNELTKEDITLGWIKNFFEKAKTIDPIGKHVSYNETIDVITDRIITGILKYCKIDKKEAKNILTWLSENKYKNLSYQELNKLYKQNVTSNKERLDKFLKKTKFKVEDDNILYFPVHKKSILNRLCKNETPVPAKIWFWDGPADETIIVKVRIDEILSFSRDNNSIGLLVKNLKNIKPWFRYY